jgi:hypothetical protein
MGPRRIGLFNREQASSIPSSALGRAYLPREAVLTPRRWVKQRHACKPYTATPVVPMLVDLRLRELPKPMALPVP